MTCGETERSTAGGGGRTRLETRVGSNFVEAAKPMMEALQSSRPVQAPTRNNRPAQLQHRKRAAAEQVKSTRISEPRTRASRNLATKLGTNQATQEKYAQERRGPAISRTHQLVLVALPLSFSTASA
jgi:hypothetical protein